MCFGQFGPSIHARVLALKRYAPPDIEIVPVQIVGESTTYPWTSDGVAVCNDLRTICEGTIERTPAIGIFLRARRLLRNENIELIFLPSYWPASILALFAAAKSLGLITVMMSDSHAGTQRAFGWRMWVKRQIVNRFDAALVAGKPQAKYFNSLGIPADRIFTGYDAIDNKYFSDRAAELRGPSNCLCDSQKTRYCYGLPEHYFLSFGRMVEKKNLSTLMIAYSQYVQHCAACGKPPFALVFVGGGEQEAQLREQAESLGLLAIDCANNGTQAIVNCCDLADYAATPKEFEELDARPDDKALSRRGAVLFYGFRQIAESPIFYSLAEAFVLPSTYEEWGLVVNEAMACSLPVIVSWNAGCAEDLVQPGETDVNDPIAREGIDRIGVTDLPLIKCANGFRFDPTSAEALATALTFIADLVVGAEDGDEVKSEALFEMRRRSREIIEDFSCENFAHQALRAAQAAERN
jgi:glycosyltransferase involved in cell wall biosynthesis